MYEFVFLPGFVRAGISQVVVPLQIEFVFLPGFVRAGISQVVVLLQIEFVFLPGLDVKALVSRPQIQGPGSWALDPGPRIQGLGSSASVAAIAAKCRPDPQALSAADRKAAVLEGVRRREAAMTGTLEHGAPT